MSSSACCRLHFSSTFFSSASSSEAKPVAEESPFVEFIDEECNAAALVASTSFCSTEGNKPRCETQDCPSRLAPDPHGLVRRRVCRLNSRFVLEGRAERRVKNFTFQQREWQLICTEYTVHSKNYKRPFVFHSPLYHFQRAARRHISAWNP